MISNPILVYRKGFEKISRGECPPRATNPLSIKDTNGIAEGKKQKREKEKT